MRPGSIALALAASAVAIGGIYLYLSLDSGGAATTPEQALAEAGAERGGDATPGAARADRNRTRPPSAPRRPQRDDVDTDEALRTVVPAPRLDLRKGASGVPSVDDLPAKFRAADEFRTDLANPKEYEAPSAEQGERLLEANKLYDRGDFEGARALAQKMLGEVPGHVKMLRVVVSSSCILGDAEVAQRYATELPPADHAAMVQRCKKFEIDLK